MSRKKKVEKQRFKKADALVVQDPLLETLLGVSVNELIDSTACIIRFNLGSKQPGGKQEESELAELTEQNKALCRPGRPADFAP